MIALYWVVVDLYTGRERSQRTNRKTHEKIVTTVENRLSDIHFYVLEYDIAGHSRYRFPTLRV